MEDKKTLENAEIIFENGKSSIEELKEAYENLVKDFPLPEFDDLNADFGIEKIQEDDTDFLIREVRRYISDKFGAYLRLIESILQPTNSQMFVFMMIKALSSDDMAKLQEIYKKLARKEIEVIELDLKFDSEKEAAFINSANEMWQEVREELILVVEKIKNNWSNESSSIDRDRNYYM